MTGDVTYTKPTSMSIGSVNIDNKKYQFTDDYLQATYPEFGDLLHYDPPTLAAQFTGTTAVLKDKC